MEKTRNKAQRPSTQKVMNESQIPLLPPFLCVEGLGIKKQRPGMLPGLALYWGVIESEIRLNWVEIW